MAEYVTAAVAVLGLGYGIHTGQQQQRQQKSAVQRQQNAQQQAAAQAARAQKQAQEATAQAARRTPDPGSILLSEYEMGRRTSGSTLLTGMQPEEQPKKGPTLLGQ